MIKVPVLIMMLSGKHQHDYSWVYKLLQGLANVLQGPSDKTFASHKQLVALLILTACCD